MPAYSTAVANRFLLLSRKVGRELTHMQLQKLVYIAHGWCLALNEAALTIDDPQAWDYGPVYPRLYRALSRYGAGPVDDLIRDPDSDDDDLDWAELRGDEYAVVRKVFKTYGEFPAFKLSALTHEANTPWSRTFKQGLNCTIPSTVIMDHFVELADTQEAS